MPRGRRPRAPEGEARPAPGRGKYYMISVVAKSYGIHPQTLRLYEREGLLKPSRTDGNTRLYSEDDLRQLEVILNLTRDLGVNLAGVEIILNMRRKMEQMQAEINEFVGHVRQELQKTQPGGRRRGRERPGLVKVAPAPMVKAPDRPRSPWPASGARRRQPSPGAETYNRQDTVRVLRRAIMPATRKIVRRSRPRAAGEAGPSARATGDSLNAYIREISKFKPLERRRREGAGPPHPAGRPGGAAAPGGGATCASSSPTRSAIAASASPFLDLIHEGSLGLIEAAKRFDPERNVKFISYAVWWVRQAIFHSLSEHHRIFRLPQKLSGQVSKVGNAREKLARGAGAAAHDGGAGQADGDDGGGGREAAARSRATTSRCRRPWVRTAASSWATPSSRTRCRRSSCSS